MRALNSIAETVMDGSAEDSAEAGAGVTGGVGVSVVQVTGAGTEEEGSVVCGS